MRLVPPIYVKPFVKRQKNDAADAEAICEAAQRPTMRFVAVKGEEQQARAMLFHTRDLLVHQRTQTINALRGHLAEFGVVAPQGVAHVGRLALALEDPGSGLPEPVRELGGVLLGQIARGGIVLDPFAGAGTTIIGAERAGRRAYGIEIDARYVDATLKRFREFTGGDPVHLDSGLTLSALDEEL